VPASGDRVSVDGREEGGLVTSAVWSPALGGPVAIASLHRTLWSVGKAVTVHHGAAPLAAEVVELPFVPRA
jgi:glycine cleavage system aminomethyltransferase T